MPLLRPSFFYGYPVSFIVEISPEFLLRPLQSNFRMISPKIWTGISTGVSLGIFLRCFGGISLTVSLGILPHWYFTTLSGAPHGTCPGVLPGFFRSSSFGISTGVSLVVFSKGFRRFFFKFHLRFFSLFLQGLLLENSHRCFSRDVSQSFKELPWTISLVFSGISAQLLQILPMEFFLWFFSEDYSGFSSKLLPGFLVVISRNFISFQSCFRILYRKLSRDSVWSFWDFSNGSFRRFCWDFFLELCSEHVLNKIMKFLVRNY